MAEFKKIVNVIPLTRVALKNTQIFTYQIPLKLHDQIHLGQIVKIPFRGREILGVTSSVQMHRLASEARGLKNLLELLDPTPVLSEKHLALAEWISRHYVTSLGLVVKSMLPNFVKTSKPPQFAGFEKSNPDFVLTEPQRIAVTHITNALDREATFLLFGFTGSGKTEVYMRVMERLIMRGKQVIILVPEISLTAQAIERFARRFGIEKIAVLGSQLADSERTYMWREIKNGNKQIIIGPRSAIFAPVQNLGLIVLDEEHDSSFKQFDQKPKYHARTVAKKLSQVFKCPLILGDATPSMETYHDAMMGKITLLKLPYRIKADVEMPKVQVIDMRKERQGQNFSAFSEFLKLEILNNLKNARQIILFLNRRGTAPLVMCRDCGHVLSCQNCSSSLVWHQGAAKLLCHHCGGRYDLPAVCPNCQGTRLNFLGLGTQSVEEELRKFLLNELGAKKMPNIARMDQDTTSKKGQTSLLYQDWASGKIQILIGTQIISKGWDINRVGLVGIISGDTMLHLPDFRSAERTFQVLTQVAGRAGRGGTSGLVILQTFNPENLAVESVKTHNFEKFFTAEIKNREKYEYPPFGQLVKLIIRHKDELEAQKKAFEISKNLLATRNFPIEIKGPIPAFIFKIRGLYQYLIILRLPLESEIDLYKYLQDLPPDVDIDVEPDNLL